MTSSSPAAGGCSSRTIATRIRVLETAAQIALAHVVLDSAWQTLEELYNFAGKKYAKYTGGDKPKQLGRKLLELSRIPARWSWLVAVLIQEVPQMCTTVYSFSVLGVNNDNVQGLVSFIGSTSLVLVKVFVGVVLQYYVDNFMGMIRPAAKLYKDIRRAKKLLAGDIGAGWVCCAVCTGSCLACFGVLYACVRPCFCCCPSVLDFLCWPCFGKKKKEETPPPAAIPEPAPRAWYQFGSAPAPAPAPPPAPEPPKSRGIAGWFS